MDTTRIHMISFSCNFVQLKKFCPPVKTSHPAKNVNEIPDKGWLLNRWPLSTSSTVFAKIYISLISLFIAYMCWCLALFQGQYTYVERRVIKKPVPTTGVKRKRQEAKVKALATDDEPITTEHQDLQYRIRLRRSSRRLKGQVDNPTVWVSLLTLWSSNLIWFSLGKSQKNWAKFLGQRQSCLWENEILWLRIFWHGASPLSSVRHMPH